MTHDFLEQLAEIEHNQWRKWRLEVEKKYELPHSHWTEVAYPDLPEEQKKEDRNYAREVLRAFVDFFVYELEEGVIE